MKRNRKYTCCAAYSDGFTLIEMMIVVAIIAVLAGVALVAYKRHLHSSRTVGGQEFISRIEARQETYFQQHGTYITADANFFPALTTDEPEPKSWESPPAGWISLGARPESGRTYFSFLVVASAGPNHALDATATALKIPAQPAAPMTPHPWYYVVGHADLDGDAAGACGGTISTTTCTLLTATSASSTVIVRNPGE